MTPTKITGASSPLSADPHAFLADYVFFAAEIAPEANKVEFYDNRKLVETVETSLEV
jgi:hypothetical protein